MIKGVSLGISMAVFVTSLEVIAFTIKKNLSVGITGAVIGAGSPISYAVITALLSLIAIVFLILMLHTPFKMEE